MKLMKSLVVGFLIAASSWADSSPQSKTDTEGWNLSNGKIVKEQEGESFVRLALKVDRSKGDLGKVVSLEPGRNYELKIEYKSDNEVSARDKGSWIYLAFRDAQDKHVSEQCETFEQATSWKLKSIPIKTPAGTAKVFMTIRQQRSKGIFDIKSVELKQADSDAKTVAKLSPAAMAAMAYISTPGEKLSPDGERSPLDGNIFLPYLKGKAPKIVRDLGTTTVDGVTVQKVVFRSMTVGGEPQDVYAVIARPSGEGNFPGILWLHGGYGGSDASAAIRYAKAGYVAISPDLPGIGDPKNCPNSVGPWAVRFAKLGKRAKPDPTADETFDAVVAALQAFDLLCAQPGVIKNRVGVAGISMGGYTTTMISGLLGERVRAAYSKFGCGFYDRGSEWTMPLRDMPDDEREAWLRHFDAGRRAADIRAPYFIAAAASDRFFWPPAVNSTLTAIPGIRNQAYAPANHSLKDIPEADNLSLIYFAYWLKGEGQPFPKVTVESCQPQPDGGKQVNFSVQAPLPVKTATLYVTAGGESWEKSTWEPISAQAAGETKFQAVIPADKVSKQG
ncbi:MAG: alpha/beta fold hydrolase, partial [Lentisphaerota bacterium]